MSRVRLLASVAGAVLALLAGGCASGDPVSVAGGGDAGGAIATGPVATGESDHTDQAAPHAEDETDNNVADATDHTKGDDHDEADAQAEDDDPVLPEDVDLVVPVSMVEFGYEFETITIPVGSTVRFDFINDGAIEHEAMFGDEHQQEEFAARGGDHGDHGDGNDGAGHHGEVMALTLGAGDAGSLVVTFDEPGEMLIGCHIAGHWDAGMVAALNIV